MKYAAFERLSRRLWREIPAAYREGVDGVVVRDAALPHPDRADVYTLGECLTESYPSDYEGPETVRSTLVLYYGSFARLARLDPDFDWEEELWETLTHELHHHLESLADEAALEAADYAAEEQFKRLEGKPFDPFYYRSGLLAAPGVRRVDHDFFREIVYRAGELRPGGSLRFDWRGERWAVPLPDPLGDVAYLRVLRGPETGPGELCVVLARRRGAWETVRSLFRRRPVVVVQADVDARAVDAAPDAG